MGNVNFKSTDIRPAVLEPSKAGTAAKETKLLKDESGRLYASLESKRKLLNLLEGYLGNQTNVADMKKRIDEALKYLEGLTGEA